MNPNSASTSPAKWQTGQSLLIMAIVFFVLLAFVGLAADGALLYARYHQLRVATDAAALSVASQLREVQSTTALERTAEEALMLAGLRPMAIGANETGGDATDEADNDGDGCIDDTGANLCYVVSTCASINADVLPTSYTDTKVTLNPDICTYPPRKLVRVEATTSVEFVFMRLFWWERTTLTASAVSESAALDVVLVLDTSYSMTYEASRTNSEDDDMDGCTGDESAAAACGDAVDNFDNDGDGCIDEDESPSSPATVSGDGFTPCTGNGVTEQHLDDWLGTESGPNGKVSGNLGLTGVSGTDLPDTTPNCYTDAAMSYIPNSTPPYNTETMLSALQRVGKLPTSISYDFQDGNGAVVISPLSVCRPFEYVRDAAVRFVQQFINFPYDHVGIVTFASPTCPPGDGTLHEYDYCTNPTNDPTRLKTQMRLSLANGSAMADVLEVLSDGDGGSVSELSVSAAPPCHGSPEQDTVFPSLTYGGFPPTGGVRAQGAMGECENTDTGAGLALALADLENNVRSNAVRIIIVLSDGAASTTPYDNWNGGFSDYYACPVYNVADGDYVYGDDNFIERNCQDGDARNYYLMRHTTADGVLFDADDYAREEADLIAAEANILMYAIGLGPKVTTMPASDCVTTYDPIDPYGTNPAGHINPDCAPNGEQLLRYIADQGDGITEMDKDPCGRDDDGWETLDGDSDGVPEIAPDGTFYGSHPSYSLYTTDIGESCGNYFYASGGVKVKKIFDEIASRIFTRLTK